MGLSVFDVMGRPAYAAFMEMAVISVCAAVLITALYAVRVKRIAGRAYRPATDHRLHDHVLEVAQEVLVRRLGHHDDRQLFLAIHPEVRAVGAAPAERAFGEE